MIAFGSDLSATFARSDFIDFNSQLKSEDWAGNGSRIQSLNLSLSFPLLPSLGGEIKKIVGLSSVLFGHFKRDRVSIWIWKNGHAIGALRNLPAKGKRETYFYFYLWFYFHFHFYSSWLAVRGRQESRQKNVSLSPSLLVVHLTISDNNGNRDLLDT